MRYDSPSPALPAEPLVATDFDLDLLTNLMDGLPDRIYFKDRASRFLRINKALAAWFGLKDPAEAVGKTDADFFTAEHAQQAFDDEQEVIRTGMSVINKEERESWADARDSWVSTTKMPLRDRTGKIVGTFGISRDITSRRLAELAVQLSEQRTRLIVDSAHEAFVGMDSNGRITDWNQQAETTFGWKREEILGRFLSETLVPHQHRADHVQGLERFLATGEGPLMNRRVEITALHRDGHELPVEMTVAPIRIGQAYFFASFMHDITKRQLAAAELQRAKEAAEAANLAKSEFLANMSHEIRTPMNAIIGMTELALDTDLTHDQREFLGLVKESANSLLTLLNDILDFSKIEAGRLDLDNVSFRLRDSLGDTLHTLALRAEQRGLELACHIRADVPEVLLGDPGRLRQILVNLVGNAIKFTEHGEVVVHVESEPPQDGKVELHFAVSDTGIGIPAEKHREIFRAFSQGDSSTTRKFGGTGLGLTISSQLVEMMGGRLWVESEPGEGSIFRFTARFVCPPQPQGVPAAEPPDLHGLRVLVVDDNATNRRILAEILSSWHMLATTVDSAEAALVTLEQAKHDQSPFALVLLDVMMPGTSGFCLAEEIRRRPDLNTATLMMLSSGGQGSDTARCRELGIAAFLTKPVKQSELLDAIMTCVGTHAPVVRLRGRAAISAINNKPGETGNGRPLRILLAEDNVVNQKLAVRLLEKWHYSVSVASNGREALEALQREAFDLVLMDVQMAEMDGFEATIAIRELEKTTGGHIPIVAMTAHAMKGDRERCLELGMDGYVAKPIQPHELLKAIQTAAHPRISAEAKPLAAAIETPKPSGGEFDRQRVFERCDGDESLVRDIAQAFLTTSAGLLTDLNSAIDRHDGAALYRAAHTIKGCVGYFGAAKASHLAEELEVIGRENRWDDISNRRAALQSALQELTPAVAGLLSHSA
jgi:two-component system sensor histidine kinase/response regulator